MPYQSENHSRAQSCDPFGQCDGSKALVGAAAGIPQNTDFWLSLHPQNFKKITVTNGYENAKLLCLHFYPGPSQSERSMLRTQGWQLSARKSVKIH